MGQRWVEVIMSDNVGDEGICCRLEWDCCARSFV